MKFILFVLLVSGATIRAQQAAVCTKANPFLSILQAKSGLQLYSSPMFNANICGAEFATYGTCCNHWQLPSIASNDEIEIRRYVDRLNNEYARFANNLPSIFLLLKQIAFTPKFPWPHPFNDGVDKANVMINDPAIKQYFKDYGYIGARDSEEFKNANNACWNKLIKARHSSLCFSCSGRADVFFKDGKALISEATCQDFINTCNVALKKTVMFMRCLKDIVSISKQTYDLGVNLKCESHVQLSGPNTPLAFWEVFAREGIPDLLQAYVNNPTSANAGAVCGKFIKLRETTFIHQLAAVFTGESPWAPEAFSYIKPRIAEYQAQVDQAVASFDASLAASWGSSGSGSGSGAAGGSGSGEESSSSSSRRRLQTAGLIGSDSAIFTQQQGQYSSVIGAPGTAPQTTQPSPMDMAQAFP